MIGVWSVCPVCGAVVADTTCHTDWHQRLAERTLVAPIETTGQSWPTGLPVPAVPPITDAERAQAAADRAVLDELTTP